MKVGEVLGTASDAITVKRVFAEPFVGPIEHLIDMLANSRHERPPSRSAVATN